MGSECFEPLPIHQVPHTHGCFTCAFFQGKPTGRMLNRDNGKASMAVCERGGGTHLVGIPMQGCAYWQRIPGGDDE